MVNGDDSMMIVKVNGHDKIMLMVMLMRVETDNVDDSNVHKSHFDSNNNVKVDSNIKRRNDNDID